MEEIKNTTEAAKNLSSLADKFYSDIRPIIQPVAKCIGSVLEYAGLPILYHTEKAIINFHHDCGNDLSRLAKKSVEELMCYRGIGKNRAIAVVTACEFGKRFRKTAPEEKPVLKDAISVGNYMMPQLEDLDVEEFWALFLNPKHEMLRRVRICRGEVSENAADPRNIMRFGVLYNATYIVTVHNQVSGNPSPTKFDSIIAARLKTAAEAVRMTLRDHIILAEERYFSFKENKKL